MQAVRTAFLATVLGAAAILFWQFGRLHEALGIPPIIGPVMTGVIGLIFFRHLWKWMRLRQESARWMTPTGLYGQGRIAIVEDAKEAGLLGPVGPDSFIFGALDGYLLNYPGLSHVTVVAPNNAGKTESLGNTNAMAIGHNLVVTDKGGEIARRTLRYRSEELMQSCAVINPWRIEGLPSHSLNVLDEVVNKIGNGETDFVDVVRAIILLVLAEPKQAGDNAFFRAAARDLLVWLIVTLAYWQAFYGELVCNFPYLYDVVCGSRADLLVWISRMEEMDYAADGLLAKAAGRIRSQMDGASKTFENVLFEAQTALAIFDRLGPLGRSMTTSDFDTSSLKTKPSTIYVAFPPEKLHGPYAVYVGLVVDSLIRACLNARTLHPKVTFLLDEFANLSPGPLPAIMPALFIGRSYGVRLVTMVQDLSSYKQRYGQEATAFITQAELILTWGVRDIDDADYFSKKSGTQSVVTETLNLPAANDSIGSTDAYSFGFSEKEHPVLTRSQILGLPRFKAVAFYQNMNPIVVDLVSYREIAPFATEAATLPGDAAQPTLPIRFKL